MTHGKISGHFAPAGAFLAVLLALSVPQAPCQAAAINSVNPGHEGMDMSMPMHDHMQASAEQQAILARDKKESEFNHHLAGFLVILAGFFLLAGDALRRRWPLTRFAWPVCFFACGLFLLVFSDTELWPFGPQSWWYGLTHNLEDLQHKTFAVTLLALGALEFQRARSVLKSAWAAWVFPVLALFGSVLLLFHEHHGGMHGVDHMTVMKRIQEEHLNFAIAGSGVGVVKGLSELRTRWQAIFMKSWPLLLIILGVLLMRYTE
jgi:copper resistance protein D